MVEVGVVKVVVVTAPVSSLAAVESALFCRLTTVLFAFAFAFRGEEAGADACVSIDAASFPSPSTSPLPSPSPAIATASKSPTPLLLRAPAAAAAAVAEEEELGGSTATTSIFSPLTRTRFPPARRWIVIVTRRR